MTAGGLALGPRDLDMRLVRRSDGRCSACLRAAESVVSCARPGSAQFFGFCLRCVERMARVARVARTTRTTKGTG
jgi:hypothetical protein